jgi:ADP-ribose pyrophosphatase YjhB (NUDIX family)
VRAQVVLLRGDRILLARHHREDGDYWVLPGGSIEEGEVPEDAAVRETREETGLEIEIERLLFIDGPRRTGEFTISSPRYTFVGRITGGELALIDEHGDGNPGKGHLAGAEWMPWESEEYDAATRDTLAKVRKAVSREP